MSDPQTTDTAEAEILHRRLFANSDIRRRNWPDIFEEEIAEIKAALNEAYERGKRDAGR